MKKFCYLPLTLFFLSIVQLKAQKLIQVKSFEKVIVSPHIQVTFLKAESESVTIDSCGTDNSNVNIYSNGTTLSIYLKDAREVTKTHEVIKNGVSTKEAIYKGTILVVTVRYKQLKSLSMRGEQSCVFASPIVQDRFEITLYGESKVHISNLELASLKTTIYGESYLELKSGKISEHKLTAYGESKLDALGVTTDTSKLTLYGESTLKLNIIDQLNIQAFGGAKITYKGNPAISKGISIGHIKLNKID